MILSLMRMVHNDPMNNDTIKMSGMESMPNLAISSIYRLKNTFHFSGTPMLRHMNIQYLPNESSDLFRTIF